jgi:hypothetical protein
MKSTTYQERIVELYHRVNELAAEIEREGREQEYLRYLKKLEEGGAEPKEIDDVLWGLMLPAEKKELLLSRYHTLRTELLELKKKEKQFTSKQSLTDWLNSPWIRGALGIASLIKAASFVLHILSQHSLFLRVSRDNDMDVKLGQE